MTYWQKSRNYRKYQNNDGTITHIITVDGQDVDVSAEVYQAYSQADRRERYQAERDEGVLLSLERLRADNVSMPNLHSESAEDAAVRRVLATQMLPHLESLSADEKELITLLFYENLPLREVARQKGVYHRTIAYRRDQIIAKIKKYLEF